MLNEAAKPIVAHRIQKRLDIDVQYECELARGPDADRNAKILIIIGLEGANFDA